MSRIGLIIIFIINLGLFSNEIKLIRETNSAIEISYYLESYNSDLIRFDNNLYEKISIPLMLNLQQSGIPQLPYAITDLIIPDFDDMQIEIEEIKYDEIKVNQILPAHHSQSESLPFDESIYNKDVWFPEKPISMSKPYIFRDFRGITLRIIPFQYNDEKKQLRILKKIHFSVKSIGLSNENTLQKGSSIISDSFSSIYKKHFLNFKNFSKPKSSEEKLIIICHTSLLSATGPFTRWKNQKGFSTILFEYPTDTGDSPSEISIFLKNQYQKTLANYCLFIGNKDKIPTFSNSLKSEFSNSDWLYGNLDGTDSFPEMIIGRLSCDDISNAELIISQQLDYEKNPLCYQQPDFNGIIENPSSTFVKNYNFRVNLFDEILSNKILLVDSNTVLSSSPYWLINFNHLSVEDELLEKQVPTVKFSFSSEMEPNFNTSELNSWIAVNKFVSTIPILQILSEETVQSLNDNPFQYSIGIGLLDIFISNSEFLSEWNYTWMNSKIDWNFYGDPTLLPYFQKPKPLSVYHDQIIASSKNSLQFVINNQQSNKLNSTVAISKNDLLYHSERFYEKDNLTIDLPDTFEVGLYDVVVSSKDYIPYIGSIQVVSKTDQMEDFPRISPEIYPNPYFIEGKHRDLSAILHYDLPMDSDVQISIFNSRGQIIKNVFDGYQTKGDYSFRWDATDDFGRKVASGTYFYLLEVDHRIISKKMLIVK